MLKRLRMAQEYQELCAAKFKDEPRIAEAASLLILAQSGVVIDETTISSMANRLCHLAAELNLEPEDVQAALYHNEPLLGIVYD